MRTAWLSSKMEKYKLTTDISPDISAGKAYGLEDNGLIAKWVCLFSIILGNLFSLRLQNVLTLMTMAIGAMALSATIFTGEGAMQGLWDDLDRFMGNRVIVYSDAGPNQILLKHRTSAAFTAEDVHCITNSVSSARYIVSRFFGRSYVTHKQKGSFMPIDGIQGALENEAAFKPELGRKFSESASGGMVMECLVTRSAYERLGLHELETEFIRMDNLRFRVVGVIVDPPEADQRFRARIVVPYFWARLIWGEPGVIETLAVAWSNPRRMEETIVQLRQALNRCRAPGAYYLSSSQFKIQKRKQIVSNFMVLGTSQSLFCIIVASMGIVNVMLANVVRRMREFAIRVAMGANQRDIVILVLCESFMLGFLGAVIGIVIAAIISPPLCELISSKIREASQLKPLIGMKGISVPLAVCSISGLIAGIIPAIRARRMDILSVLRAE